MLELLSSSVLVLLAAGLVQSVLKGESSRIRTIGMAGLGASVVATFAQVIITRGIYGGGDMLAYLRKGEELARYARLTGHSNDLFVLAFGGAPRIPVHIIGAGSSTGNMAGMAGLLIHFLGGAWAASFAFAMLAFTGKLALFTALRDRIPHEWRSRTLGACILVPSLVFWTSAVLKESACVAGLGWLVLGLDRLSRRKLIEGCALVAVGATFVGLSKAYMLFTLAASTAVAVFWRRGLTREGAAFRVRPTRMVAAGLLAAVMIVGLGELFPRYAFDNLGEEAAKLQGVGSSVRGGSNYDIGDAAERGLLGQLAYAPVAIVTSLFRPFPFEVSNGLMFVNAIETFGILCLWLVAWRRHGAGGCWRIIRSSPVLVFCACMTLLTALGVGLTTTNLGTLSRYRVPMFPFYLTLLLVTAMRSTEPVKLSVQTLRSPPRGGSSHLTPAT